MLDYIVFLQGYDFKNNVLFVIIFQISLSLRTNSPENTGWMSFLCAESLGSGHLETVCQKELTNAGEQVAEILKMMKEEIQIVSSVYVSSNGLPNGIDHSNEFM